MERRGFFDTQIEYLKGVGPQRGELLRKELGIFTFSDLLYHFPFRYVDRSRFYKVSEINDDNTYLQLKGRITRVSAVGQKRASRLVATFEDDTGATELVWFKGIKWIRDWVKPGSEFIVFGKPTRYKGAFNFAHPEIEPVSEAVIRSNVKFQPVYNTTEKCRARGLDSKGIMKLQKTLQQNLPASIGESLPTHLISELKMMSIGDALQRIHFPSNANDIRNAQFRLKFEELFYIQLDLLNRKLIRTERSRGHVISKVGDSFNDFYENRLPFELTGAQKKVIREVRRDLGSGHQMNRLVQGDVGSGKTLVALMSMILLHDSGFQAALMAPTEILAQQHYSTLTELLDNTGMSVDILTGNIKGAKRTGVLERLADGELNFIVGTHALIEDQVKFKNLGLVVIDEQHRFGVAQRARLWDRYKVPPHVLVMTATPIPRTLAMTIYGDLDTSVIDELPPGRKPVKTIHRFESARLSVIKFLKGEIAKGRQVYIVYPLIEESEKLDYMDLQQGFEGICRDFPMPEYRVSMVHGRMKPVDKEREMQAFADGKTNIMIATTVIEVGVNVPNASVMVIESAERFGLSQLHQLRGRVGRGAEQSYCILMTGNKLSDDSRLRMQTMVSTNDGFEIAEVDLRLRGPGDMAGTQQSGQMELRIADLAKDGAILETARKSAIRVLDEDPALESEQNIITRKQLMLRTKGRKDWSKVS
jgi:ATP-dependent DNA helicase RecG